MSAATAGNAHSAFAATMSVLERIFGRILKILFYASWAILGLASWYVAVEFAVQEAPHSGLFATTLLGLSLLGGFYTVVIAPDSGNDIADWTRIQAIIGCVMMGCTLLAILLIGSSFVIKDPNTVFYSLSTGKIYVKGERAPVSFLHQKIAPIEIARERTVNVAVWEPAFEGRARTYLIASVTLHIQMKPGASLQRHVQDLLANGTWGRSAIGDELWQENDTEFDRVTAALKKIDYRSINSGMGFSSTKPWLLPVWVKNITYAANAQTADGVPATQAPPSD